MKFAHEYTTVLGDWVPEKVEVIGSPYTVDVR